MDAVEPVMLLLLWLDRGDDPPADRTPLSRVRLPEHWPTVRDLRRLVEALARQGEANAREDHRGV